MDGMPLTLKEIKTFCDIPNMKKNLDDLVEKGYLTMGYPLDLKTESKDGNIRKIRFPREDLPKGYNIVVGKLSFEISNILDPNGFTPTLVATDSSKLAVFDSGILRQLTNTELKRLFGFPERFKFNNENKNGYDLFGNSISVNVVKSVSERLLDVEFLKKKTDEKYIPRKEYIQKEII